MTICHYYQQGRCSFGNQCRFEHSLPNRSNEDMTNTLVKTVELDMETWEKGRQWVFSCYAPAKEVHCFPDIDDISPEEMRYEAYASRQSNSSQEYQQKFQALLNSYAMKRKALAKPSEEIKGILRRLYAKEKVVLPPGSNIFNAAANVGSIFGGSSSSSNTSSIFQSRPNQSFGGGASSQSNASSVFGGGQPASSNSIFGGSATKPSIFGGSTASNPSAPNPFSSGTQSGSSSIFGGGSSTQPQGSSIFGGSNQSQASSSIFAASAKSPFGQSSFGQPANNTTNIFGGGTQSQMQQSMSGSNTPFGQPSNVNPSGGIFGGGSSSSMSSPFGGNSVSNQGTSAFGGQTGTSSPSMGSSFGGQSTTPLTTANPFSNQTNIQSPFGNPSQSSNTNPTSVQSPFGNPSQNPTTNFSPFGNPTQNPSTNLSNVQSPFGNPAQSTGNANAFSNPPPSLQSGSVGAASGNPFLSQSGNAGGLFAPVGGGNASTGLFGQKLPEMTDSYRYTPLDQFTPEELTLLQSEEFELGRIPERPPPLELCF